jgi:hypothetical protein
MLGIFGAGSRSNNPLSNPKEAKRILGALAAAEPFESLEGIVRWLASVRSDANLKPVEHAQLLRLLDEAGQAPEQKLGSLYLSAARINKQQEARLWTVIHDFWTECALGYLASLDVFKSGKKGGDALRSLVPLLGVRGLHSLAESLKWDHVRYGPMEKRLWSSLTGTYALLDSLGLARAKVIVHPENTIESTPQEELLRAVMFGASSPASLLPLEIELAQRIIARCAHAFQIAPRAQADTLYWIDLAQGGPPVRIVRPPPHAAASVRYLSATRALEDIDSWLQQLRALGEVPSALALDGTYDPAMLLGVLEHLETCWRPKLSERRHPRHRVKSRLTIAWGFDRIIEVLQPEAARKPDVTGLESWIVENVSIGGFGATVPQVRGDWLKIGCLVAVRPEGGDNWLIGAVRRLARPVLEQAAVGIQTLARSALPIELQVHDETGRINTERGVLLDPVPLQGEMRLLIPRRIDASGHHFSLELEGARIVLQPVDVAERRADYELLRCRTELA